MSRASVVHLNGTSCAAVRSALVSYARFYTALAASETRASVVADHRASAAMGRGLAEKLGSPGAHHIDRSEGVTLERAARMWLASLQQIAGNRRLSDEVRAAARSDIGWLDDLMRELCPYLQHAPKAGS